MSTTAPFVFKVGDNVRFTALAREELGPKITDEEIHTVGKIEDRKPSRAGGKVYTPNPLITFLGATMRYAQEGSSGDEGYIPRCDSFWLEPA